MSIAWNTRRDFGSGSKRRVLWPTDLLSFALLRKSQQPSSTVFMMQTIGKMKRMKSKRLFDTSWKHMKLNENGERPQTKSHSWLDDE
jgi:hypothetical protein